MSAQTPVETPVIVTCEHGGNRIPAPYRNLFRPYQSLLSSHRGFDPGALVMAKALAAALNAPLLSATTSRLLVDLNRSSGHPHLHLEAIRNLPAEARQRILAQHYRPYRDEAERLVTAAMFQGGRVIHIACHSFTPELRGVVRNADIGLLYDPVRPGEKALCASWKSALKALAPELRVRRNYPYEGRNDGLTASFRKQFSPSTYLGIELEINQKHILGAGQQWRALRKLIINALLTALAEQPSPTKHSLSGTAQ